MGGRSVVSHSVVDYTGRGDTRHTSPSQVSARTELVNIYDQFTETFST